MRLFAGQRSDQPRSPVFDELKKRQNNKRHHRKCNSHRVPSKAYRRADSGQHPHHRRRRHPLHGSLPGHDHTRTQKTNTGDHLPQHARGIFGVADNCFAEINERHGPKADQNAGAYIDGLLMPLPLKPHQKSAANGIGNFDKKDLLE